MKMFESPNYKPNVRKINKENIFSMPPDFNPNLKLLQEIINQYSEGNLGENITSGILATATASRVIPFGGQTVVFSNMNTVTLDALAYFLGDGLGNRLPSLDTDSASIDEILAINPTNGIIGRAARERFEILVNAGAPADGTTVAWYVGQLLYDSVNDVWYRASAKSTNPDSAGTGSTWVNANLSANITTGTLATATGNRNVNMSTFNLTIDGTGSIFIQNTEGDTTQQVSVNDTTVLMTADDDLGGEAYVQAANTGILSLSASSTYRFANGTGATLPTTDSDVAGFSMIIDTNGNWRLSSRDRNIVLSGAGAPVDGTTVAWHAHQLYYDTTNDNMYRASAKSTDPDSAGTGSVWVYNNALTVEAKGGNYTYDINDVDKHIRFTAGVADLHSPVAAEIGYRYFVRNETGVSMTVTSSATLNGLTGVADSETLTAVVVAAGVYDLSGGI